MTEFLRTYQGEIMHILSGICGVITFFVCITKYRSKLGKLSQLLMTSGATFLLIFENLGEFYYGQTTPQAYWMVRICNFFVFFILLLVIHGFSLCIMDEFQTGLKQPVPKALWAAFWLLAIGELLIIISQFTGLYYTFDEMNVYHRSDWYVISYIFPLLAALLLFGVILRYHRQMQSGKWIVLMMFALAPLIASIIQFFVYGIYVTEMTLVGMVIVLYVFILMDSNRMLEHARQMEVQHLKEEQENMQKLFLQTALALVSTIDAKDTYTHGHSARVADYSRKIAEACGKNDKECDEIYYAALLHDVGKIGIPERIINKHGKLTEEEFRIMKRHPVIGSAILSNITDFLFICLGAKYHHERYDGSGYPEGLKGEDIPEMGRIISVADAYDAMTSRRSYREIMP